MAKVIMIRNTFGGCKYLQKALKYIRDERAIAGGAFGVDTYDPEVAFYQMMCTKRFFNKTGGNPLILQSHIQKKYSLMRLQHDTDGSLQIITLTDFNQYFAHMDLTMKIGTIRI